MIICLGYNQIAVSSLGKQREPAYNFTVSTTNYLPISITLIGYKSSLFFLYTVFDGSFRFRYIKLHWNRKYLTLRKQFIRSFWCSKFRVLYSYPTKSNHAFVHDL